VLKLFALFWYFPVSDVSSSVQLYPILGSTLPPSGRGRYVSLAGGSLSLGFFWPWDHHSPQSRCWWSSWPCWNRQRSALPHPTEGCHWPETSPLAPHGRRGSCWSCASLGTSR